MLFEEGQFQENQFEEVQFEEDWFFTPLQWENSVLKRPKFAPLQYAFLRTMVEEGRNLVWGLEDSSYSRDFSQKDPTSIPLPFFEGSSLPR